MYEAPLALKGLRLTLFNPVSGVIVVDSEAEFNLTAVDGPSDMQYTMEFDDRAGATPHNDSYMLLETFSIPGEYVVTATANDTASTVRIHAQARQTKQESRFIRFTFVVYLC